MLVFGRDRLRDDPGRERLPDEASWGKKPDCRRRGDGEGGICERVSIVRSANEGLGRRCASVLSISGSLRVSTASRTSAARFSGSVLLLMKGSVDSILSAGYVRGNAL